MSPHYASVHAVSPARGPELRLLGLSIAMWLRGFRLWAQPPPVTVAARLDAALSHIESLDDLVGCVFATDGAYGHIRILSVDNQGQEGRGNIWVTFKERTPKGRWKKGGACVLFGVTPYHPDYLLRRIVRFFLASSYTRHLLVEDAPAQAAS